jgi:hypothetical protein
MVLGIDFDGTIVEHEFPDIGAPVPGALNWLREFRAAGARLILWTMRSGETLDEAVEFCRAAGVEFWGINKNPRQATWTLSPKAYCELYIDDAAFGCPLRENPRVGGRPFADWSIIGPEVLRRIELKKTTRRAA